mmetsp:Transcript_2507/g.6845  ORF Transcript_2507/g.6845 Transcript_2507/m.6845 type:complete len:226 (+) Transcript_2507:305-982(+)
MGASGREAAHCASGDGARAAARRNSPRSSPPLESRSMCSRSSRAASELPPPRSRPRSCSAAASLAGEVMTGLSREGWAWARKTDSTAASSCMRQKHSIRAASTALRPLSGLDGASIARSFSSRLALSAASRSALIFQLSLSPVSSCSAWWCLLRSSCSWALLTSPKHDPPRARATTSNTSPRPLSRSLRRAPSSETTSPFKLRHPFAPSPGTRSRRWATVAPPAS